MNCASASGSTSPLPTADFLAKSADTSPPLPARPKPRISRRRLISRHPSRVSPEGLADVDYVAGADRDRLGAAFHDELAGGVDVGCHARQGAATWERDVDLLADRAAEPQVACTHAAGVGVSAGVGPGQVPALELAEYLGEQLGAVGVARPVELK